MSVIGAVNSPYQHLMNFLGFSLIGIVIMMFGLNYKKNFSLQNMKMWNNAIITAFLISGFFLFLVGFFPCDPDCVDVTVISKIHSIFSTIPAILLPTGIMMTARVFEELKDKGKRNIPNYLGPLSFITGILSVSSGMIMLLPQTDPYLGLIQRLGIGFSLIWISFISFILNRISESNE